MAVTGNEPVQVSDLKMLFPLPIELGGTGASTVEGAVANLGIYDIVEQVVQNFNDIKDSNWKGSAMTAGREEWTAGTYEFVIRQSASSANINITGGEIKFTKAGTYQFTGTVESGYCKYAPTGGASCSINLTNGKKIGGIHIRTGHNSGSINASVSLSAGAQVGINFVVPSGAIFGNASDVTMRINNLAVQRTA